MKPSGTLNLTTSQAPPLRQFIASFSSLEGPFWAKLLTASAMAIAPIPVLGWLAQNQPVIGHTFWAAKAMDTISLNAVSWRFGN